MWKSSSQILPGWKDFQPNSAWVEKFSGFLKTESLKYCGHF